eukprot:1946458-Prymnesium_polylepis.1
MPGGEALCASLRLRYNRRAFPWRTLSVRSVGATGAGMYAACWVRAPETVPAKATLHVLVLHILHLVSESAPVFVRARQCQSAAILLLGDTSASPSVRGTQIALALTQMLIVRSQPPQL